MMDNDQLDEIRKRIQETLSQAKRDELRDKYGMEAAHTSSQLSPEEEIKWLDDVLKFEEQFENAQRITVRERIGNPIIQPVAELPLYALEQALDNLLNLLAEQGIFIDFMGDWDDLASYRFVTEEILDEEIDDIRIEGMQMHFEAATPAYDVQMWVDSFVLDLFTHEREYFLSGLDKQPLFNMQGEPITAVQFKQQIETVWKVLPRTNHVSVEAITVAADEEEGTVTAVVAWHNTEEKPIGQVESFFRLQPSPYTGWDIVQTSLLDDLLLFFGPS